jgi:hypothetical protein
VFATIPSPTGVIYACYSKSTGTIRVLDNAVGTCKQGETQLTWNQTGPAGPVGAQGPVGNTGPRGPSDGFMATQGPDEFDNILVLGGQSAPIKSITLSAGNYVVNANVTLGSIAFIRCDLEGPTGAFGASTIGPEVRHSVPTETNSDATAGITTAFSLAAAETVTLWCRNYDLAANHGAQVQFATITAVQTATLTVQP